MKRICFARAAERFDPPPRGLLIRGIGMLIWPVSFTSCDPWRCSLPHVLADSFLAWRRIRVVARVTFSGDHGSASRAFQGCALQLPLRFVVLLRLLAFS